jgi:hypothetical protein
MLYTSTAKRAIWGRVGSRRLVGARWMHGSRGRRAGGYSGEDDEEDGGE